MTDKPEQSQFTSAQLAMAGICAAVVLVIIVIAMAFWNSVTG